MCCINNRFSFCLATVVEVFLKLIYFFCLAIRQERPVHLHPDAVYQAMRERGRAIPATPTIPIVDRKVTPSNPPPRIVEGRVSYSS